MTKTSTIRRIAALALVCISSRPAWAAQNYGLEARWGRTGSGPGEFREPMGVGLDAYGNVFVADSRNRRVQKLSPEGRFLAEFGGADVFEKPVDVAVGPEGTVYIADYTADRIRVFSKDGKRLYDWGEPGEGSGQFRSPAGIAVDEAGDVYVADFYNSRVQVFDARGRWIKSIGKKGRGRGEFTYPTGLAFDGAGDLLVADAYNHRIQKFAPDGRVLDVWGSRWKRFYSSEAFHVPSGVAADGRGVYVADSADKRVVFLGPKGEFRGDWKPVDDRLPAVYSPTHIAVDRDGRVYAADTADDRILVLAPGASDAAVKSAEAAPPPTERASGDMTVRIEGMACPFCAYGIEKHLGRLPGVRAARVDLGRGTAVLELEPGKTVSFDEVRKAVEKAGFRASELKGLTPLSKGNP